MCSGVLAAAIRLLRRQQPDVVQTVHVGEELPDSDSYWYDCCEPRQWVLQTSQRHQWQQQASATGSGVGSKDA